EGPNIGLMGSLASMATVSEFGFIQTPYSVVKNGRVTEEIIYLDAAEEAQFTIAQASAPLDEKGKFLDDQVLCRYREGEAVTARPQDDAYMAVAPAQIASVPARCLRTAAPPIAASSRSARTCSWPSCPSRATTSRTRS